MPNQRRKQSAEVAELLTTWRAQADISQSIAAQMLGVSVRTLQGWEAGRRMSYPKILALALEAFR